MYGMMFCYIKMSVMLLRDFLLRYPLLLHFYIKDFLCKVYHILNLVFRKWTAAKEALVTSRIKYSAKHFIHFTGYSLTGISRGVVENLEIRNRIHFDVFSVNLASWYIHFLVFCNFTQLWKFQGFQKKLRKWKQMSSNMHLEYTSYTPKVRKTKSILMAVDVVSIGPT